MKKSAQSPVARGSVIIPVLLVSILFSVTLAVLVISSKGTKYEFSLDDVQDKLTDIKGFLFGTSSSGLDVSDGRFVPEAFSADLKVLSATADTVTIRLNAKSTKGQVREMKVWTGNEVPLYWKKYQNTITVPLGDFVHARFRDHKKNVSDVFTQNTYYYKTAPTN